MDRKRFFNAYHIYEIFYGMCGRIFTKAENCGTIRSDTVTDFLFLTNGEMQ